MSQASTSGRFVKDTYTRNGIYNRRHMASMARMLDRVTFGRGITGRVSPRNGIHIEGLGDIIGGTKNFGIVKIVGAKVTIKGGDLLLADNTPVTVADIDLTIGNDHEYVSVKYTWATAAFAFESPTTTKPVSDSAAFKVWLHRFRLINGAASWEETGHDGNIIIPAAFRG